MEVLTRRVGDMELLVLLLLGTSGLYALVFVASSYLSGKSFARQADQTVASMRDQIGAAISDFRELREQTPRGIDAGQSSEIRDPGAESRLTEIAQRLSLWKGRALSLSEKLELAGLESEAAYLQVAGGQRIAAGIAGVYRDFAAMHAADDAARARFYLDRALLLALPQPPLASEIRYDLACWFAAAHDYRQAIRELEAAFEHQSRALDARLSIDLEEGGKLYALASTTPFDRQLNDLLLNVSIP